MIPTEDDEKELFLKNLLSDFCNYCKHLLKENGCEKGSEVSFKTKMD